ncbi:MAG: methyltransferase domain-containing protein [Candidatus Sulfotelmatobacter sp.]
MQRVDAPEILDSDACSPADVETTLRDLGRVNRWFGGVATTQKMVERVAQISGVKHFSLLEVASGSGEVPETVRQRLARRGIALDVTLLDRARSHLPSGNRAGGNHAGRNHLSESHGVVADTLALPFGDGAFDLVSCNLFAHHLNAQQLAQFVREGLRVSRRSLLINDLIRHPLHLVLAFAGFPLMRSRVAWLDGLTSVRRAYVPDEIRSLLASAFSQAAGQVEISRNYLFRMGVIVWKGPVENTRAT